MKFLIKKYFNTILYLMVFIITAVITVQAILYLQEFNKKKLLYKERKKIFENLAKEIQLNIDKFPGEVGLYLKDLQTGVEIKYNENKLFPSASLVKIPIMASVYQAAKDNNIDLNTKIKITKKDRVPGSGILKRIRSDKELSIDELVELMITESDNTATNILTERLGFNYINWIFKNRLNLRYTNFDRKIMELSKRKLGIENYTTAKEIGILLEKIYTKTLVSKEFSEKMLSILSKQKINDRIPRFLPSNITIAHKTGFMRDICHDAGIIFTPNGDFILCVLTSEVKNVRYAKRFIGNLAYKSYLVYY